jgi:hypothetical protein
MHCAWPDNFKLNIFTVIAKKKLSILHTYQNLLLIEPKHCSISHSFTVHTVLNIIYNRHTYIINLHIYDPVCMSEISATY